jgi:hypothetical protein
MTDTFDQLPWHDAVILGVEIDRRRAGDADEVTLAMQWPDEQRERITFFECYALDAALNFGIIAAETVLTASELEVTDKLGSVRARWSRRGVDLSSLRCFRIETNSTASILEIYAKGWRIERAR